MVDLFILLGVFLVLYLLFEGIVHLLLRLSFRIHAELFAPERADLAIPETTERAPMTQSNVISLRLYHDLRFVRPDHGLTVLADLILALSRTSPAQAEYYTSELCEACVITPEEHHVIFTLLQDERRHRTNVNPLQNGGLHRTMDTDGGPEAA